MFFQGIEDEMDGSILEEEEERKDEDDESDSHDRPSITVGVEDELPQSIRKEFTGE